jgi:molecular chaperone DnaJ
LTLEEAYQGVSKTINVYRQEECDKCAGYGTKDGKPPKKCDTCSGKGYVRARQGFFTVERACPTCHGRGFYISDTCSKCHGSGTIGKKSELSVNIPQGVSSEIKLKVSGEGNAAPYGGSNGDLYVHVNVRKHNIFEREGENLYFAMPVPMHIAALGGEVDIPTIDGKIVTIAVPKGSQSGKQLKVKNKGMPKFNSSDYGDLYISLNVEVPVNLSRDQVKVMEKLGGNKKNYPEFEKFKKKIS